MKIFTVLLASFVLSAPAEARLDQGSADECYKLQTEWFDAMASVCKKFRADDMNGSVCPPYAIEKSHPNWAAYREVAIAARTKECATVKR